MTSRIVKLKSSTPLLHQGEPFSGLYLILEGEVEVTIRNKTFRKIAGNIVSFYNLLNHNEQSKVTAMCKTDVTAQLLDMQTLSDTVLTDRLFVEQIIMTEFQELFYLAQNVKESDLAISDIELSNLASQCEICQFKLGDLISIESQGLLVTGKVKGQIKTYTPFWIIQNDGKPLQALDDGIIIQFSMKNCSSLKKMLTIG